MDGCSRANASLGDTLPRLAPRLAPLRLPQRQPLRLRLPLPPLFVLARRWRRAALMLMLMLSIAGCQAPAVMRLAFPSASGMDRVSPTLFVEPAMSATERDALQDEIARARRVVVGFFGEIRSAPVIVACATDACDRRLGARGERAAAYGASTIRLSPRGRFAALIAHEWSHAEVFTRVGGWWQARRLPRWFDEGLAVAIANEPRHSPAHYQGLVARGRPMPALDELRTFDDWIAALRRYGDFPSDRTDSDHVVYTTAGETVRRFVAHVGPAGVLTLLERMRDGVDFAEAYQDARSSSDPQR